MRPARRTLFFGLVALATLLVTLGSIADARVVALPETGVRMLAAARAYLGTLTSEQQQAGSWELDAEQRFDWHFVPRERYGVRLQDMTAEQRVAAHELLTSVLSGPGYLKATGVMHLEAILRDIEDRPDFRNPEDYWFNVFGTPSADGPWAWRFEGHHISLSFTAAGDELPSVTPRFIGSNPHVVGEGPYSGFSLLSAEESLARQLMASLSDAQRDRVIFHAEAPRDIVTGTDRTVELDVLEGLPASELAAEQLTILMRLVREYIGNVDQPVAQREMERIAQAGLDQLHFAWAGSTEPGEGHYYRIHGPTVFIEYDNVQGGANHVHSVVRDPENDFGDDLLQRHYEEAEHHQNDHSHGGDS